MTGWPKPKRALGVAKKVLNSEEFNSLVELLDKKTVAHKAALALQKGVALAEITINLQKQIAANSEAGAKISASAPPVTVPLGVAYTIGANIVSTLGAGAAVAKIVSQGFRQGGATGAGAQANAVIPDLTVAANGKLLDSEGYAVAGVVHENEYVIPEWMRADPKVVQIEQFLEAKRQRGYREGGATSDDVVPAVATAPESATDPLLREVLTRLDSRLAGVEQWARELSVALDVHHLEQTLDERDATRKAAEIR